MSGGKIIQELRQAAAHARATLGGPLTVEERAFLVTLREDRVATRTDLAAANRQQDRIRQRCKRFGWAEFVRPKVGTAGWVLTAAGAIVLREPTPTTAAHGAKT